MFKPVDVPLKFEEAIEYFKDKVSMKPEEFAKLSNEYKTKAFTVGGIASLDIIKKFMEALEKALEEGKTMEDFRKDVNEFLKAKGYEGITPFQADNIFRTNIQTAYNVGHYKRMSDPDVLKARPYWQYDAIDDSHTRPTHLGMDGKVFPADHPIWDIWYPPNGYRCRCKVKSLSKRNVEAKKLTVETEIPRMVEPKGGLARVLVPDYGFDKNPAKVAWEPDMSKYPKPLQKAYEQRQKAKGVKP